MPSKTYFMYILDFLFWFKCLMTESVLISTLRLLDSADDCRNSAIHGASGPLQPHSNLVSLVVRGELMGARFSFLRVGSVD